MGLAGWATALRRKRIERQDPQLPLVEESILEGTPCMSNMLKSQDLAGVCLGGIMILCAYCFFPFLKSPAM